MKIIIFDLDGVLVSSRDLHYEALNKALETVGAKIEYEDHLANFDGLSTTKKLNMLTDRGILEKSQHNEIWAAKQEATFELLPTIKKEPSVIYAIKELSKHYKIVVCSNAIRKTINTILYYQDLTPYIEKVYSNEDVKSPKPNPEIYLRVMADFGVSPTDTLIVEDSVIGRTSAIASGAHVLEVAGPEDVTLERIQGKIKTMEKTNIAPKWKKPLNILIPAAGLGSRFEKAGYSMPKPLIDVHKSPMIKWVIDNIRCDGQFNFVIQREHAEKYNLAQMLRVICPSCNIVELDGLTEGAACTVLKAREFIDNDTPLLIANSDQFIQDFDINAFLYEAQNVDGSIVTFRNTNPKWSYVRTENGFVVEVKEKQVISDEATAGIYYYSKGSTLCNAIDDMITANDRFNSEFYLCPAYNYMAHLKIKTYEVPIEKIFGLGTPEDLNYFLEHYKGDI
jgi:HAD superfamily hydrolase (TIGR01509 family)